MPWSTDGKGEPDTKGCRTLRKFPWKPSCAVKNGAPAIIAGLAKEEYKERKHNITFKGLRKSISNPLVFSGHPCLYKELSLTSPAYLPLCH